MLGLIRFVWHVTQMCRSYAVAERAQKWYDEERAFKFLRKARQSGRAALQIRSSFVNKRWRAVIKKNLFAVNRLYQRELIIQRIIPEEDLELLASALKVLNGWAEMNIQPNVSQIEAVISVFEDAKSSIWSMNGVDFSKIYGDRNAFAPLKAVMQPFLAGEATREETEKRLDECVGKLQKWLPELILFPEGFQDGYV